MTLNHYLGRPEASNTAKAQSNASAELDRFMFSEVVETKLLGLHEGNFVRYRIKPSEFSAWIKKWDS